MSQVYASTLAAHSACFRQDAIGPGRAFRRAAHYTRQIMISTRSPEFATALARASEEHGLQDYYRSTVRPLFSMPRSQWPGCCGGGCEPCARTLVAVADRVCELLGVTYD